MILEYMFGPVIEAWSCPDIVVKLDGHETNHVIRTDNVYLLASSYAETPSMIDRATQAIYNFGYTWEVEEVHKPTNKPNQQKGPRPPGGL